MTLDDFTREAFDSLNTLVKGGSSGGWHAIDQDRIKGFYKALYADGKELNIDLFKLLAQEKNWTEGEVRFLVDKAKHIESGGIVQLKHDKESGLSTYKKLLDKLQSS